MTAPSAEHLRLEQDHDHTANWRRWGPYVSDRSWGTVREDYSPDGEACSYFPHDLARSKAYRWGEDGLAGVCDRYQILALALALWNGKDPILKERLVGLIPREANHGEDVKEYYFYLDATPTFSYARYLYKYPQAAYPYGRLIDENRRRGLYDPEFELLDTGVFNDDRYFDVVVEYAKAGPEDLCVRIEAFNRGPQEAELHILPHLWFRNTWAWSGEPRPEPSISAELGTRSAELETGYSAPRSALRAPSSICLIEDDRNADPPPNLLLPYHLGERFLYAEPGGEPLFTNNETNMERAHGVRSRSPFVKDAFHRYVIHGEPSINPLQVGTKACVHYQLRVPAGGSRVVRLRLSDRALSSSIADVDATVRQRRQEADAYYERIQPRTASEDERRVQRQAL